MVELAHSIMGCSRVGETSSNIIRKGLAFPSKQSATVAVPDGEQIPGSCPAGLMAEMGLRWCGTCRDKPRRSRCPNA